MNRSISFFIVISFLIPQVIFAADYSALFEKLDPSVVTLKTFSTVPSKGPSIEMVSQKSLGTGVVISDKGEILTAAHVVHTVDSIHVEFADGKKALAQVVSSDPGSDLALLKLNKIPENLSTAILGDSDKVKIGHEIFVIGAPLGLEHTLTAGYISSRRHASELNDIFKRGEFIQIDAAINPGNSGGPVFNKTGEVIGIVSHIKSRSGGSDGLGFAVTSNSAIKFINEGPGLWGGIDAKIITPMLAKIMHYPFDYGALVQNISISSPAAKAGIRGGEIRVEINDNEILLGGDIIISVESIPLRDDQSYRKIVKQIQQKNTGDPITVQVYRKGVTVDINIPKP